MSSKSKRKNNWTKGKRKYQDIGKVQVTTHTEDLESRINDTSWHQPSLGGFFLTFPLLAVNTLYFLYWAHANKELADANPPYGRLYYYSELAAMAGLCVTQLLLQFKLKWLPALLSTHSYQLKTDGPWAITRNPIYLSWRLFSLNSIALEHDYFNLIATAGVFIGTELVVRKEERGLECYFKDEYERYKQKVPRWWLF